MHTRVPPRVQQIMAKKLERSVPGYMKQYIGPYMQQNVVHPTIGGPPGNFASPSAPATVQVPPTLHANTGESWRQNHFQPTNAAPANEAPVQAVPGQPGVPPQPAEPYAFITDPVAPKRSFSLPGAGSLPLRIAYVAGGLLILLILFSVVKNLAGGSSGTANFLPVAQDQQEMVHLVTIATKQQGLSTNTQNFVATANLSLGSQSSGLLQYLAKNGYKPKAKLLTQRISPALDSQLAAAVANTTYEQTFQDTMKTQLNTYLGDLTRTYSQTAGKNGRALLNSDYDQAKLLLSQLGD